MIDRCCISLNNSCNLKCRYCHFKDKQYDFSSFKETDVIDIIENIHFYCINKKLPLFKLGIVGAGEPMLQKKTIFKMLEHIISEKYCEFKIYTITNGTLLSVEDLREFYQYKDIFKICYSLDGYREIHDYGRMSYDSVMKGIEQYKSIFGEAPSINATVNALTVRNKERTVRFFRDNGLFNITFSKLVGYNEKDLYISDTEFDDFMNYINSTEFICRQFNANPSYDCTMYGKLCGVGRTNIFITTEGIYPCGRFYKNNLYRLGDYKDSFFKIEAAIAEFSPIENGKCYYNEFVEGK